MIKTCFIAASAGGNSFFLVDIKMLNMQTPHYALSGTSEELFED